MNEQMMEKQIVSTPRQIHADTYTDARGERDENESVIRSNFSRGDRTMEQTQIGNVIVSAKEQEKTIRK